MRLIFKQIWNTFGVFDLFKHDVSLKIYNRYAVSISLGKFFSVGIFILLFYSFFSSDMIQKSNPIILQQLVPNKNRPTFFFSKKNFVFSFAVVDSNNAIYHDPSIFNFRAAQMTAKNGQDALQKEINIQLCSSHHFERFYGFFEKQNLTYSSCLNTSNFTIKGYWDEDEVSQLNLALLKCVNSSESNIICKAKEEIDSFFADKYFSIWMEDNNYDMNNFNSPLSSKIKNLFRNIELQKTKVLRFYMQKSIAILDNGWANIDEEIIESYSHGNIVDDFTQVNDILFYFHMYSSDFNQVFQRRYQKLFDLLARLGGMLNVLIIIGSTLVNYFYDWEIKELILNKLYTFKRSRNEDNKMNKGFKFFFEKFENFFKSVKIKSAKRSCDVANKEKLKMNFCEWVSAIFKNKKKRSYKEKLYLEYLEKSGDKLDLFKIIKKLEEIEKIKQIIFNKKQLDLFNLLKKQNLNLSEELCFKSHFNYTLNLNKIEIKKKSSINDYISKIKVGEGTEEIEKKLLRMIG